MLLTESDRLPAATAAALADIAPARVVALGGEVVVSDDVLEAAAAAAGGAGTDRLSGPDRFATATAVAGLTPAPRIVYVAVGTNFPDALAAAPAAAANRAPILLTRSDALPDVTRDAIAALDLDGIVLLGGPDAVDAVDAAVERKLVALLAERRPPHSRVRYHP